MSRGSRAVAAARVDELRATALALPMYLGCEALRPALAARGSPISVALTVEAGYE